MLFILFALFCSGFARGAEIGRKPAFDLAAAPPRNIFLEDLQHKPSFYADHPSLKIVNGQPAKRGQFCYQVFVLFTDGVQYWFCGGSLISPTIVLTAAHCVIGAESAIVVMGATDFSKVEEGRKTVKVSQRGLLYNEKYDSKNFQNDIGALILPKPVEPTEFICFVDIPSCSANVTTDLDNQNNTVAGWGKTSDTSSLCKQLRFIDVATEKQSSCADFYSTRARYNVTEGQMCTSGAGGKSTCNGDSGGPLVQRNSTGHIVQVGIVSLGLSSCQRGAPSVFTLVEKHLYFVCPLLQN